MRRVINGCSFADWTQFQPRHDLISGWLEPAKISDASDPKIVHLHGLNLSRAWCWRQLLPELDPGLKSRSKNRLAGTWRYRYPATRETMSAGTGWRRLRCWR